jgi:predicted RNA-binding protein with PIN domain
LIEVVLGFHSQEPYELRVVFDGQGQDETHQGRSGNPIRVVFGGDADSFIVRAVKEHPPERIVVVSSDRLLCRRARGAGAEILSPMTFLSRCREG